MLWFVTHAVRMINMVPDPWKIPPTIAVTDLQATAATLPREVYDNVHARAYALAGAIIRHFLGINWVNTHVLPTSKRATFFRLSKTEEPHDITKSEFRVLDLAELLFNLQSVRGFEAPIAELAAGKNESAYAELDFARMLYVHEIPFQFVVRQGKTQYDYDYELKYPDGFIVCAEAKCKIEASDIDMKSLKNSLENARKQLPKDRPGIIFVKVPQEWVESFDVVMSLHQAVQEFLRNTTRIVSVKFYVSHLDFDNGIRHRHAYKEFDNPNNKFFPERNWDLFADHEVPKDWNGMPPWWTRIMFFPQNGIC